MNPAKKPQLLVCYLCGQQFGTSSLPIHMPQCYDKKIVEWQNADPKNRGPRPRPPHKKVDPNDIPKSLDDDAEVEQFNNRQFGNFTDNMAQCQNCGRKFLADRLEVHLRSCKPGQGSKPIAGKRPQTQGGRSGSSAGESGPARKPQLLVCYLCGQQFGTSSLAIHMPQCFKKKTIEWENADPKIRGPRPRQPSKADFTNVPTSLEDDAEVEQFNNRQFGNFTDNMAQCQNCGRKFLADRLEVHLRSCKPGQGSKPIAGKTQPQQRPQTQQGGAGKSEERKTGAPAMLVCYLCGQQFGTSSLRIHIPQCYQKRLVQWKAADPNVRGPAPRDPATMTDADFASMSQDEKEQFNNEQFSDFNNNMSKCDKCGRTFLPDRLAVHQRSCKGGAQGSKPVNGNARPHTSAGPDVPNPASSPKKVVGTKARTADAPEQKHLSSTANLRTSTSQRVLMSLRFEDVDINGDGLIDKEELKAVLSDIGFSASNEEVDSFLGLYDTDDDGMINLADWESANFGEKILHFTGSDQATVPHAVPVNPRHNPLMNRQSVESGPLTARTCAKCRTVEYDLNAKFCQECGGKLPSSAAPTTGSDTFTCVTCGDTLTKAHKFCSSCGTPVSTSDNHSTKAAPAAGLCPNCSCQNDDEARFCEECGTELIGATTPVEHSSQEGKWNRNPLMNRLPQVGAPTVREGIAMSSMKSTATTAEDGGEEEDETMDDAQADENEQHDDASEAPYVDREACPNCKRCFAVERLDAHVRICMSQKKRAVFNASKHRVQGTEMQGLQKTKDVKPPRTRWKEQSMSLRAAMKESKQVAAVLAAGGTAKDLPPPTYSENAHYVQCPHCSRRFAPDTAERHIPRCASTMNRPKPPPKKR